LNAGTQGAPKGPATANPANMIKNTPK